MSDIVATKHYVDVDVTIYRSVRNINKKLVGRFCL